MPTVKIRILDMCRDFMEDEAAMDVCLKKMLRDLLQSNEVVNAKEIISNATSDCQPDFLQQVNRFVKVQDRYLALASLLLKNRIFWEKVQTTSDDRPIVLLPRTEHKKPYIPAIEAPEDFDWYPLSISHQWPFAGSTSLAEDGSKQLVGFDIVTFEEYNPRLYHSNREYIHVFREYFAPVEWETIFSPSYAASGGVSDEGSLREFYVQWSVKEAYTKALGVGLGYDFQGFHFDWYASSNVPASVDEEINIDRRLWNRLRLADGGNVELTGALHRATSKERPSSGELERWKFLFLPLVRGKDTIGAACACVGPLPIGHSGNAIQWDIERNLLADMIQVATVFS